MQKNNTKLLCKMYEWNPFVNLIEPSHQSNYALLILNSEINLPAKILMKLWENAVVRHTVDGGTSRWLSWLKLNNIDFNNVPPPDLITGDMDSIAKDVLDYFTNQSDCKVIKTPNQDETDFTKALMQLKLHQASKDVQSVYVLADTSGRFDQILANINTLFKAQTILPNVQIFQVASNSLTWLLAKGEHSIAIPKELREGREWCALIPFKSPSVVTTSGLKWNLKNAKMEFGGLVSTSNTYSGEAVVTVSTDSTIVWSMGIKKLLKIY